MTSLGEVFRRVARHLESAGIPHMVVGSLASSYHGQPRTTQDIDIVIDPSLGSIGRLVAALEADAFYVDAEAAAAALEERSQFNAIDQETGWKVDLIVRSERPFSRAEFGRRQPASLIGSNTYVATPEDTIIAKLEWARAADSERQIRDVAAIVGVSGATLDHDYLGKWLDALDLKDEWEAAERLAESTSP